MLGFLHTEFGSVLSFLIFQSKLQNACLAQNIYSLHFLNIGIFETTRVLIQISKVREIERKSGIVGRNRKVSIFRKRRQKY